MNLFFKEGMGMQMQNGRMGTVGEGESRINEESSINVYAL